MRARVSGGFFLLGVLLLTVDPVAGQPGGGKFGRGGFGGPPGGFGQPGQPGAPTTQPGSYGQQPGGFGQQGGGFGGRTPDPERTFNFFARGAESIDFGQMPPEQKVFVKGAFERMGLPAPPDSGVMTKSQFVAAFTQAQAAKAAQAGTPTPGGFGQQPGGFSQPGGYGQPGGFGQQPGGFGQPGAFGQQPGGFGGPPGGFGGKGGFQMTDEDMLRRFRESDRNQDGMLSYDEASDRTKQNWAELDVNRRGYVTFDEYKGYMQRRMAAFAGGTPGGPPQFGSQPQFGTSPPQFGGPPQFGSPPQFGTQPGADFRGSGEGGPPGFGGPGGFGRGKDKVEDFSNVAIRYGKLPPGLPDWFAEYDQDKDGQINMYEWRTVGGKSTAEFRELDANGDGLIAPQELIRVTAAKAEAERMAAIEAGETPSKSGGSRFGGGSMGGRGFGGPGSGGTGFGGPPMMGKGGTPSADGGERPDRSERGGKGEKGERPDRGKNNPFANGGRKGG